MAQKFDLIVIGSGPGGYVAAIRAAQLGLKVACIDKRSKLGGTCLNVGCIPSKTLLHSSEFYSKCTHDLASLGLKGNVTFSFSDMQKRKDEVVGELQQGIELLFQKNKVTPFFSSARFLTSTQVYLEETKETLEATNIIIATGSEPASLPFLPLDEKRVVSSTGALALSKVPKKMIVIGAGVIGVELGSVYKRLGTEVVFVEFLDRICPTFDEAISKELQKVLTKQGLVFHLSTQVTKADVRGDIVKIEAKGPEQTIQLEGDVVLVSVGRKPYTKDLGLEKIGLSPTAKGTLLVDGHFRTAVSNVFAIGDVIDGPMLAHKASEEGVAVAEIIAGHHPKVDYTAIPNVVYSNPEVASVGFTESEAKALNVPYLTGSFPFKASPRAKCMGEHDGFVKVISHKPTDRLIGMHIIGAHASELIAAGVIAIQNEMTVTELGNAPFAHPTLAEAMKEAALALHKRAIHR